eukprot:3307881-Rhodomonas_salina.1
MPVVCSALASASSTAADEIETPPLEIAVSVRTRLPADTCPLPAPTQRCAGERKGREEEEREGRAEERRGDAAEPRVWLGFRV